MICAAILFAAAAWAIPALIMAGLILWNVVWCGMNRYELALALVAVVFWPIALILGIIACSYADRQRCSRDVWP
ncbi:hypothetical protein DBR17_17770 [Sphingomonas sp. HMWF008]|nr:hypothetical protein DBR17_17770 [Sphingomonas sp. HMWF008]